MFSIQLHRNYIFFGSDIIKKLFESTDNNNHPELFNFLKLFLFEVIGKMLRIITANLNGIRSAAKKGFFEWLEHVQPDILCVQELKAQQPDLDATLLAPKNYLGHFHYAQKKGYSGVGLYALKKPDSVQIGFDNGEFDAEGRYVEARFGNLTIISVYFPSGSSAPERQEAKFRFLDIFMPH